MSIPDNGYRWWYIDATSDDGLSGLTIIGFVGSVFSPYYTRARRRGLTNPENHCAINVALYGKSKRWAMTERSATQVERTADHLIVGPSSMRWDANTLTIEINERCVPFPRALRGRVTLKAENIYAAPLQLDQAGNHFWQAVAPHARIEVAFERPGVSWTGRAYHDMNWGNEPLEKTFRKWSWLRSNRAEGTDVLYDVERRDGSRVSLGRSFCHGEIDELMVPEAMSLPNGIWGMARNVNSEAPPRLINKLEDTPFYTRNHVELTLYGETREAVHETLSLDRLRHPLMQLMLPFRMPRVGWK